MIYEKMVYSTFKQKFFSIVLRDFASGNLNLSTWKKIKDVAKTSQYTYENNLSNSNLKINHYDVLNDLILPSKGNVSLGVLEISVQIENINGDLEIKLLNPNHSGKIVLEPDSLFIAVNSRKYSFKSMTYSGMLGQYTYP